MDIINLSNWTRFLHWNLTHEIQTASQFGLKPDLQTIFIAKIAYAVHCGIGLAGLSPKDMSIWLRKCADHIDGGETGLPNFKFYEEWRSDAVQ